ncbi:MAG TPA: TonB-dependent receptor [Gemmatimonadales bacterium]|nr:TonB-dependent receptor [Gemmatimonadales bacterium]
MKPFIRHEAAVLIGLLAAGAARAAAVPSGAADTVRGTVRDSAGHPLPSVEVLLTDLSRRTTTGADGAFAFAAVPNGAYTLVFRRPGYGPLARHIDVTGSLDVQVVLRASAVQLDAVTVTATRAPADPLSSPLPTATLGAAELAREYRVSLAHALEAVAGVRALTTGGEIGKPVIRGLTGARVLVLGDGNRLEDYSWSDEDGPSVETRLADRVEVIRGPASVLYGSDALGGVVNVIPEDVPDAQRHTPVRGGVDAYFATNNHELGSALHASGATGGVGFLAGLVGRHSEALHTPVAELENTGFTALSGEAAAGTQGEWGKATARFTHYGGEFHLLEADTGSLPPPPPVGGKEEGPVRKLTDDRLQLGGTIPAGRLRLEAKGQWQRHWLAETVEGDTAAAEKGFDLLLNTTSLDLLAHHGAGARVSGTVGTSAYYQSSATRGDEPLVPGARAEGAAAFAFEQVTLGPRWSALAGARVDLRRLDADSNTDLGVGDQRRDYTAWSGDVGLVFRPAAEIAVAANVGRAWRPPTLFELFTNGPHPGEARFEIGQADLVPEAGLNLDLSIRWQAERVRGEMAGFSNTIDHYIYIAPTGTRTCPDPAIVCAAQDSLSVYRYAQADARLLGGEASLEVAAGSAIALSARVDFVRGERRDNQEPLPQIPPLRAKLGAEWHRGTGGAGVDVDLVARQTRLSPFDQGTAGYGLLDLFGSFEPRLGPRAFRVEVQVKNVLNTSYRDFLSRYKAFALNPGRNIVLRVGTEL